MHLANANAPASLLCPVSLLSLLGETEEPQAAVAIAQPRAANAIGSPRRWRLVVLLWHVLVNVVGVLEARSFGQSRGYTAGGITRL
jgi:hypothetical protein